MPGKLCTQTFNPARNASVAGGEIEAQAPPVAIQYGSMRVLRVEGTGEQRPCASRWGRALTLAEYRDVGIASSREPPTQRVAESRSLTRWLAIPNSNIGSRPTAFLRTVCVDCDSKVRALRALWDNEHVGYYGVEPRQTG
ncbi:hypothetical protein PT2222_470007 [Paraburkholderia tropica]